jgi:hypothetical protein
MLDTRRKDQPVARVELYILGIGKQGKSDAACQAEQGFTVGMTMHCIHLTRAIGPSSRAEAPGLEISKYFGFRKWIGMGPPENLDPCRQGLMIRRLFYIHDCIPSFTIAV